MSRIARASSRAETDSSSTATLDGVLPARSRKSMLRLCSAGYAPGGQNRPWRWKAGTSPRSLSGAPDSQVLGLVRAHCRLASSVSRSQVSAEELPDPLPAVFGGLGSVAWAVGCEERVAGSFVGMEVVDLAGLSSRPPPARQRAGRTETGRRHRTGRAGTGEILGQMDDRAYLERAPLGWSPDDKGAVAVDRGRGKAAGGKERLPAA